MNIIQKAREESRRPSFPFILIGHVKGIILLYVGGDKIELKIITYMANMLFDVRVFAHRKFQLNLV